jgi:predicted ATPase
VHLYLLLAAAYADAGAISRSAAILRQALERAEEANAHSYLAELYRLHGTLPLHTPDEAEMWLYRALELAQAQGAKLWELRATVSLARLWQTQGRGREARARLSAIYHWFDEGFEMPDLVEARRLLTDLGG